VFCVAGHLGGSNDWESDRGRGFRSRLASVEQLRELRSAGIEVGSHGFSHLPASMVAGARLERELVGSRDALEHALGTEVRSYAYPYGALPDADGRRLVERTYAAACTTRVALVPAEPDLHALPRVDAHYVRSPELLRRAVEGSLGRYLAARRLGSRARRVFRQDYVSA
jgi:peptidoglycan/xylan/chitin deacetylase (PgdA/CDA1 family)